MRVLPKKQGGWRLITNLSAPHEKTEICTASYSSFHRAVNRVQKVGPIYGTKNGKWIFQMHSGYFLSVFLVLKFVINST